MSTRVAFVTGGAQGLGEAIALRLAKDGLDVAILDILGQEDKMEAVAQRIKDTGRRAHWVVGDVSKEESVISAIKSVVDNLGRLDVVCISCVLRWTPLWPNEGALRDGG